MLGVCNNADGIIHSIELDPRKDYLTRTATGYSAVNLRFPPIRVLVYLQSADDAGLQLDGMPRGVIAVAPIERTFSVIDINKRKFSIKRHQLPLTAGCLSSVYRSQGQTLRKIILNIRQPPGPKMDTAAVYVALSRATGLNDLNLLFPITINDLNQPNNVDTDALVKCLSRLYDITLKLFLDNPACFTPASASLDPVTAAGPRQGNIKRRNTTGRHGPGATSRVAHLLPNSCNNCFFNSSLALALLAAWDGQQLPQVAMCTPSAATFFATLQLLRDSMLDGSPLPADVSVRQACDLSNCLFIM